MEAGQRLFFMSVLFIIIGFISVGAEKDVRHPVGGSSHLFTDDFQINAGAAFNDQFIIISRIP